MQLLVSALHLLYACNIPSPLLALHHPPTRELIPICGCTASAPPSRTPSNHASTANSSTLVPRANISIHIMRSWK